MKSGPIRRFLPVALLVSSLLSVAMGSVAEGGRVHIGRNKQLFLDDYLIESLTHSQRVFNQAQKAPNNPVIRRDRPWEGNEIHYATVLYDDKLGLFRMWYTTSSYTTRERAPSKSLKGGVPKDTRAVICYAVSKDGFHWEKPSLGRVEFAGSKENNLLAPENWQGFKGGIFIDPLEKDPARRYKALGQRQKPGSPPLPNSRFIWDLYYSADAFDWKPYEGNPVIDRPNALWGPTSMMWDPIRGGYAGYMENCINKYSFFGPHLCPLAIRIIGRAESRNLIEWSEPETILIPDSQDPPDLEFYSMWTASYEGLYIGMLWNFRTTETSILPQFVFSRDGYRFDRRYRQPFIRPGVWPREFDSVAIYALQPILHRDQVFVYDGGNNWRSVEQMDSLGDEGILAGIGLAVVPRDGFVSIDSGRIRFGEVVTRTFTFSGKRLELNMRAASQGWGAGAAEVRVEMLGPDHSPIPGYAFADSDPLTRTGAANQVSWKGNSDVSGLAGKPVKLKFYSKSAKLFAFQFME